MKTTELQSGEMPQPGGSRFPGRGKVSATVLAAGLLLAALNLRIGVASVGPPLSMIREDLGLSATAASLLTTIPVVAFGAFAFLTPALGRRLGMHRLLGATMGALAVGIVLRLHPAPGSLFAGTVIIGAAIAMANVVMPAAIKHDFARRAGLMMGLYSTALFVGAALASGATVPLLPVVGGDWRGALALWAVPAVIALVVLVPQLIPAPVRDPRAHDVADAPARHARPSLRALLADRTAIAVTALMGIQSMGYYAALTWVPTILQDRGMDAHAAGWMLSYSSFPGIAGALLFPVLAKRLRPTWLPVAISVALTGAAYLGLATDPVPGAYVWMTLLGLGQGAAVSLSLSYILWRSPDAQHTGQLSTMAQGFGYLLAGLGPVGVGALHSLSGGWTMPLAGLGALLVLQMLTGVVASRDGHVLSGRDGRLPAVGTGQ